MSSRAGIHAASLGSSDRLRRVVRLLCDGQPHSTLEITQACSVCAVNSIVSELRARTSLRISCRRVGDHFEYQLQMAARERAVLRVLLDGAEHSPGDLHGSAKPGVALDQLRHVHGVMVERHKRGARTFYRLGV